MKKDPLFTGNGHKLKYRILYLNRRKCFFLFFFSFPDWQVLEQMVQRDRGFFILGDTQDLTHPKSNAISMTRMLD